MCAVGVPGGHAVLMLVKGLLWSSCTAFAGEGVHKSLISTKGRASKWQASLLLLSGQRELSCEEGT